MDVSTNWFLAVGPFLIVIFFMAFYLERSEKHSLQKKGLPYYRYMAFIQKHEGHYSLMFPDFPGCMTVAEDLGGLYILGQEVLLFQIESMLEQDEALPAPTPPLKGYHWLEEGLHETLGFWVLRVGPLT